MAVPRWEQVAHPACRADPEAPARAVHPRSVMVRSGSSPASAPAASTARAATSGRPVRLVVVRPEERVDQVLGRHPGATPSFNRTLRVALAMRGGVSLAVWIGGTVAELDLLRRIRLFDVGDETLALVPETAERPLTDPVLTRLQAYAEMLDAAGYDRVEFDLLAGASAGGLNAVVYAVAQRAGTGLDRLLSTWGSVGGFWGLLHPPGARGILALMQGENYFRAETGRALVEIYDTDDRHPDLVSEYTAVDLSVTVIDASDEYEEDANEGRGHFRFVGDDAHRLDNRIPTRGRELEAVDPTVRDDDLTNLSRLALAARSTSSLPGGFEPAAIDSFQGDAGAGDEAGIDGGPGMRFAFAGHRSEASTPYRVVDGAVFDNVPIERALRAARSRVSDRRADRAMIFLDPEPDPPLGGRVDWDPNASRFFRAIKAMFDRQLRRESVAREVAELERFNTAQQVARARFESAAPLVASALADPSGVAARRPAYLRALSVDLADHLAETIAAPSLWQLHSSLEHRRRYRPIPLVKLTALADVATERVAALSPTQRDAFARSPLALADAANCVLGWSRALEALPAASGSRHGFAFGEVRGSAYAALTAAIEWRDRITVRVLETTAAFAEGGDDPTVDDLRGWIDVWLAESRRHRERELWDGLDTAVALLRIATVNVERELAGGARELTSEWAASPWRPLGSSPILSAVDLPPLYHSAGIPPALSSVRYWAIGVDEPPADPQEFRALVADQWYAMLGRVLRRGDLKPTEAAAAITAASSEVTLDRGSKLAGYGVGNFLGFLARDWRVNDWWWGRLDGAAGIARFLTTLAPDGIRTEHTVRVLQDAVLAEADEPEVVGRDLSPLEPASPSPTADGGIGGTGAETAEAAGTTRRARLRAGTDTIFNLDPSYRFAIASRAVRLFDRVVVQPVRTGTRWLAGAALFLMRPVLVPLPTVFDPPRLALVSGFAAAVAWLLTWDDIERDSIWWLGVALVAGLVAIAVIAGSVASRLRHWSAVADALDGDLGTAAREARRRALRPAWSIAGVAMASVLPFMIAIIGSNFLLMLLCLGVTVVLTAIAVRAAGSATRARIPGRDVRTIVMISIFALLGGVLPFVQLATEYLTRDRTPAALEVPQELNWVALAIGAAAVTIALTWDWLRIRYRPPVVDEDEESEGGGRVNWINLVNWCSVTIVSVLAGLTAYAIAKFLTVGIASLLADTIAATAFIVAWANVVWWMPDGIRRLPRIEDRVERAPMD
ncbi:DUF3376 domain-containing protein [Agromyces sp. Q22]|uniref:DUF3376 domain-containing protein n=2 Tax=Agromyces kandeliae TaxID=2666141 RepID=A0A6L5R2M1_9MICO|nr:DUF3376 domain-containing protein [Agromyces kandeliae]